LAGIEIPKYMQGKAFLGSQAVMSREYVYMFRDRMDERYDFVRAVRDQRFRYIRNYLPFLPNGQHVHYLWQMPAMKSWWDLFKQNRLNATQQQFFLPRTQEELYDTWNDPDEIHNLASDPSFALVRKRMSKALEQWMIQIYDTGFMPEAEMLRIVQGTPPFEYTRSSKEYNVKNLLAINKPGTKNSNRELQQLLRSNNSLYRYWGLCRILIQKEFLQIPVEDIEQLLNDESPNVRIMAAEILVDIYGRSNSIEILSSALHSPDDIVRLTAINAIDRLENKSASLLPDIQEKLNDTSDYVKRLAGYIVSKQSLQ
jgi:hypothetical protein